MPTAFNDDVPGWFCLASPLKCIAEGPERGDKAPPRCPECGAQIGVTIWDEEEPKRETVGELHDAVKKYLR